LAYCGRYLVGDFTRVHIKDGSAYYCDVQTCGSIWCCPVDAARIRQRRSLEIEAAAVQHLAGEGSLGFMTGTLPHQRGDALADSLGDCMAAWKWMQQHRAWRDLRGDIGLVGQIRATEVTFGAWHGWHPHHHLALFAAGGVEWDQVRDVVAPLWGDAVERLGRKRPGDQVGLTLAGVELVKDGQEIARYLGKLQDHYGEASTLGREMSRSDLKKGRKRSRTPFEIAAVAVQGVVPELPLWWEYEQATKGRRAMEWSRGLKARFDVEDLADDDLAKADVDGESLGIVTAPEYALLVRSRQETHLLDLAEEGGGAAVHAFLAGLRDQGDQAA
jgi:hypothetical protein